MDIEKLKQMSTKKVLVFGDYMLDKYSVGDVTRISPEAPVPILKINKELSKLGGAGNVINNIVSLSGKVRAFGFLGKDNEGDIIIKLLKDKKVDIKYIKQYKELPTVVKTRVVSKNQQFLRIDKEEKPSKKIIDEYYEFVKKNIKSIFNKIDILVISDYDKYSVSNDICKLLINYSRKNNIPVIIDPKGDDYSKYKNANILTPNLKELSLAVKKNLLTDDDIKKYGSKLKKDLKIDNLLVTMSEKGIGLINENNKLLNFKAIEKEVIDVSGAGDTVVAIVSLLTALNYDINDICKLSNIAASIVISKFGTSTVSLNELIKNIYDSNNFKYQSIESLKYIVDDLKEKNKKIVFTNGCFDMLHVGHLSSLKQAKEFGDILIVAVNSDKSVKENKGDLRPIIKEEDRIKMLCELECVDYVVLMNEKTPEKIISLLKPDISVKGEDWKNKEVPELKVLKSYGGKLKFIKLEPNYSTTKIIERVLRCYEKK